MNPSIERIKSRYIDGDLTDAEFEERVESALKQGGDEEDRVGSRILMQVIQDDGDSRRIIQTYELRAEGPDGKPIELQESELDIEWRIVE